MTATASMPLRWDVFDTCPFCVSVLGDSAAVRWTAFCCCILVLYLWFWSVAAAVVGWEHACEHAGQLGRCRNWLWYLSVPNILHCFLKNQGKLSSLRMLKYLFSWEMKKLHLIPCAVFMCGFCVYCYYVSLPFTLFCSFCTVYYSILTCSRWITSALIFTDRVGLDPVTCRHPVLFQMPSSAGWSRRRSLWTMPAGGGCGGSKPAGPQPARCQASRRREGVLMLLLWYWHCWPAVLLFHICVITDASGGFCVGDRSDHVCV